jgi:hypothetical protein
MTAATLHARLERLRAIEQADPDRWKPPAPGYISRATRYTELRRELLRRLARVPSELAPLLREGV